MFYNVEEELAIPMMLSIDQLKKTQDYMVESCTQQNKIWVKVTIDLYLKGMQKKSLLPMVDLEEHIKAFVEKHPANSRRKVEELLREFLLRAVEDHYPQV